MISLRKARVADAIAIGAVHVAAWRSTYPGILPDAFLAKMSVSRQAAFYDAAIRGGTGVTVATASGTDVPLEDTRQGRLQYYVTHWTPMIGRDLELAVYDIPAGHRSGRHRHIPEELLLVVSGSGYDIHDGTRHEWRAGDLICIPPMTEHQHVNDGEYAAQLVSVWLNHPTNEFLGGIEHIEDASTWTAP